MSGYGTLEQWLIALGIPTYKYSIVSPIPAGIEPQIPIAKQLQTQIGRIYGLSIDTDTVTRQNQPLITTGQAQVLYLDLVHGATNFWGTRLDDMLFNFPALPIPNPRKYLEVNIPGDFDLSTSFYINPTGIVSPAPPAVPTTIQLNLWYISVQSYNTLVKRGLVWILGNPSMEAVKAQTKK